MLLIFLSFLSQKLELKGKKDTKKNDDDEDETPSDASEVCFYNLIPNSVPH
jgi:hypothetical protein